jgi:hypothetical protein
MAFNAQYNAVPEGDDSEREATAAVVRQFLDEHAAQAILLSIEANIMFLAELPPGNDRISPGDPRYRRDSGEALRVALSNASAIERLASTMQAVYQVRCNLIHGNKFPEVERDRSLVDNCIPIIRAVVEALMDADGPDGPGEVSAQKVPKDVIVASFSRPHPRKGTR